ncbi:heavy metal translocating P-type ATPase [Ferruginibacter albus]|uniref:heavy metal translocating P-type ATPase n=1 Tax=Ferruginibacter albus TaxID=2875540 RepID=UPI001CC7BF4C|nr:cation-translocating P-type ATPase [Ferruginibacter albus]UAY51658.1 cadmium-translocating P-type ATPase [Ferruginibacter albus]
MVQTKKIEWKVEGMDCNNCAITISKYLKKEGLQNVTVNFIGGDVSFDLDDKTSTDKIKNGIEDLGYHVAHHHEAAVENKRSFFKNHFQRFLFCLPFTAVLLLHMLPWHIHFLMNGWIQMLICLPVFLLGMSYFGTSAYRSLSKGVPNMNVLIAMGALAAFVYSFIGTVANWGMDYFFYETTATIITLVFLGEWIEHKSLQITQKELNKLAGQQKVMANMIAFDGDHKELIFPVENTQLHVGDLILIKNGEQVPTDCKILWGSVHANEALLTGENKPVQKGIKDPLIGGSIIIEGTVKAQVTAVGKDTVLSNILNLVKQAQHEKPPMQQLADKISAVFVPLVIGISIAAFVLNYFILHVDVSHSLMRSIAVLVISCPCAMGLATPAAIAVGLGRAARNGILFRNAKSLELFKNISMVVFDKTGTLTKGELKISGFETSVLKEDEFKRVVFSLEKYSNHPIAKAVANEWKTNNIINWKNVEEVKGVGIKAEDKEGNSYLLGSHKVANVIGDTKHTSYLLKNDEQIGWFDVEDEIRTEAKEVVSYLHSKKIKTYLLSGDNESACKKVAAALGIENIFAERSPEEKLKIIEQLNKEGSTAMVGDGINDAPALAKATIGISMSEATQVAVQTAQVVLMNKGIQNLPLALGLGKHTFGTIKENLFWAFIYNIVAIPVAILGLLQPGVAALAMGFSDVVLAANSVRLNYRKVV